jgi:hypothetical protein
MSEIKSYEDLLKVEKFRTEKFEFLEETSKFAIDMNKKLRAFNLNHPKISIIDDIEYYFHKVKSKDREKDETRLEHIMRHYNTTNRDPITVKQALYHFLQKVINPFESPLNEIKELFSFIEDLTSMKFEDTLVFRSFRRENKKESKNLSFYHIGSNILVHTKFNEQFGKYEVLTCYVHTQTVRNDHDIETGTCPITGFTLKALANLSDTQLEELAMINFELVAHNKQIFQSLQLPNNVNVSTKPTKKVISNNLQSVEDKRSSFPIPKQKIAA